MTRKPFLLFRIIGNPLPPRHDPDEIYEMVRLILENEPHLEGCERRWMLNRIKNPELTARCIELIRSHGQISHEIPYEREEIRKVFFDYSGLPHHTRDFKKSRVDNPESTMDVMAGEWITRFKSRALISLNPCRNEVLKIGKDIAEWILPLDGWSYFSSLGWESFTKGIESAPKGTRYAIIPLVRLMKAGIPDSNDDCLDPDDEPQVAFHHDAPDRFNPLLRYGNRNKTEFLDRIGCKGFWTRFKPAYWDTTPEEPAVAKAAFVTCGRVYRISSTGVTESNSSNLSRGFSRIKGRMIAALQADAEIIKDRISTPEALLEGDKATVRALIVTPGELLKRCDYIMRSPPRILVSKKKLPNGATPNDFYTEYPKPDEKKPPVFPFLHSKGKGEDHDREALRSVVNALTVLTRTGTSCDSEKHFKVAAKVLTSWFLHSRTRMNPGFDFAGLSHKDQLSDPASILEIKDLWVIPRIARILENKRALPPSHCEAFRKWCSSMLLKIVRTDLGIKAYDAPDSVGTWTHLLALSLCVHARRPNYAARLISSLTLRLVGHCREGGVQPHALISSRPLFLSLFNATAWVFLANVTRLTGFDLWRFKGVEGESVCMMLKFLQSHMEWFAESRDEKIDHGLWLDYLVRRVPHDAADADLLAPPRGESDPKDIPEVWGFLDSCDV